MADVKIENMSDIPPMNRYLSAIAVCNSLALLASQGTLTVYLQRIRLLKTIQKTWTKGNSCEIALTVTAETNSDEELQPEGPKKTLNIHYDLESLRIEVDEAGILPEDCLMDPVMEDVNNKIRQDVKQVKEKNKQLNIRVLRSNGSKPQGFNKMSKGKQNGKTKAGKSSAIAHIPHGQKEKGKTKAGKSSAIAHTPHGQKEKGKTKAGKSSAVVHNTRGQKDQFASETLSFGSAGEGTTDDAIGSAEFDFICTECGLHFETFIHLKNHRQQEHSNATADATDDGADDTIDDATDDATGAAEFDFICTECGLHLETFVQLKNHRRQEHAREFDFICTECGQHLRTFVQLKNHRQQEHGFSCDRQMFPNSSPKIVIRGKVNRLNDSNKPKKNKKRPKDLEIVCSVCDKKFSMKHELRQHQTIHSEERPYMCSICGKSFRIRSVLTMHMKIHFGDKRHTCSHCGKSFVQSSSLKDHLAVHTKLRPHICSICGKGFIRTTMLKNHMRLHTGEKPYCCSVCEQRFAMSRQLKAHLRTHSNEWPYSCDVCSKKFKLKGGLNQHMKSHEEMEPLSCNVCRMEFNHTKDLRVHLRTHSDTNPWGCSQDLHIIEIGMV